MKKLAFPIALFAATLLAGCNSYSWNREAGDMDTGSFGNATMQNHMAATGQIQAPMSNDKYDPVTKRWISGKYAAVIWQGYIAGGTSQHIGSAVGSDTPAGAGSGSGSGGGSGSDSGSGSGSTPSTTN